MGTVPYVRPLPRGRGRYPHGYPLPCHRAPWWVPPPPHAVGALLPPALRQGYLLSRGKQYRNPRVLGTLGFQRFMFVNCTTVVPHQASSASLRDAIRALSSSSVMVLMSMVARGLPSRLPISRPSLGFSPIVSLIYRRDSTSPFTARRKTARFAAFAKDSSSPNAFRALTASVSSHSKDRMSFRMSFCSRCW